MPHRSALSRGAPLGALLAAALLAGCASTSQPDPMQVRLDDVDQRLGRVERVVNNQSLIQLSERIDALETQLRALRGEVDELQNTDQGLRKQQRDLYADLNQRVTALEGQIKIAAAAATAASSGAATTGGGSAAPEAAGGAADSDQAAYAHAFDALKSGDYAAALTQFRAFLKTYPQSALADNAQYWLGEAYYVTRDFDAAATAFRSVGEQYPQSRKAPDALLKLGYTQVELKHLSDARATLAQVVQRYPGTDAARLATERLAKLPPDAHPDAP